ncbi:MAG: NAD(P)H-dependent oxidoreductase subunit E [Oscillospiraceae bacterium]|nr:NAD(P)H-dependent oxidoreductase subunit E [Oscillospiraceae bacterium]
MAFSNQPQPLSPERKECIDKIIASYGGLTSKMLEILLDVQDTAEGKYISEATAHYVAEQLQVKITQVYDVITFFSSLHDAPRAQFPIQVCSSIVCKVNDSDGLMEHLQSLLGVGLNEPTADGKYIIEEVPCFGACDVAPAIRVNGVVYGKITSKDKLAEIINSLR